MEGGDGKEGSECWKDKRCSEYQNTVVILVRFQYCEQRSKTIIWLADKTTDFF